MDFWLFQSALVLILLAAGGFMVFIVKQQKAVYTWSWRIALTGFACLTLWLAYRYQRMGMLPVINFKAALIFSAWAVLGSYLMLNLKFRLMVLGTFLTPLAAVLLIGSLAVPAAQIKIDPALQNIWLSLHILSSLLGNGMFAVCFIFGAVYLAQERQIKQKHFGSLYQRLPSLETLDAVGRHSLVYGFSLLTIGMVLGSIYAQISLGSYWQWDAKEVWTLIVWLVYAVLLHERFAVGLRGRKAAWLSILAFMILVFSFVGVNFWLSGYHSFENLMRVRLP